MLLTKLRHAHRRALGEDIPPPPKTAIAGPEYFGLTHPAIVEQLESLDPERTCTAYWAGKQVRPPTYPMHLTVPMWGS
jgi:hypothetical protein